MYNFSKEVHVIKISLIPIHIMKSQWNPKSSRLLPLLLDFLVSDVFSLAILNFLWVCYWPFYCLVSNWCFAGIAPLAPDPCLCWHQSSSSHKLKCCHLHIRFPNGRSRSVFFYYVTFPLDLEETFSSTISENILVVSLIVRAKNIGFHNWNCLRILVKCLILLHLNTQCPEHSRQCFYVECCGIS